MPVVYIVLFRGKNMSFHWVWGKKMKKKGKRGKGRGKGKREEKKLMFSGGTRAWILCPQDYEAAKN